MNSRRLKALLIKETLQIVRDPSSILIAVIIPFVLLFLMGYAVSLDARNIPLGIVSHSNGDASGRLVSSFLGSKYFEVDVSKNKTEVLDGIQKGKIKAMLFIDENFGKNNIYKIQIITDGTEPSIAGLASNYAAGVIELWAQSLGIVRDGQIDIESRYWFNPPVSSRYYLVPGSIAIVMTLVGTLLTALVIAREWERGTMEAMMATPASMNEIIVGKLIPYFFLGLGCMLLCFLVAYLWYEIPFVGNFLLLLAISALYLFPALSIGLLISTAAKNQFVAAQVALIAGFLPAFLLSGFLFEIENMPQFLQILTHIIPARYFVDSLQTIFLAGNIYQILIYNMIGMIIVGAFFFILVLKKTKKGLE
jgi:ABC-2 type transport system permease protein